MTLSQAAQVLGSVVHDEVANLAGRSVGVAATIEKRFLQARHVARVAP